MDGSPASIASDMASPPCLACEMDPVYAGYLDAAETVRLLAELWRAERWLTAIAAAPGPELVPWRAELQHEAAGFAAALEPFLAGTPGDHPRGHPDDQPPTPTDDADPIVAVAAIAARLAAVLPRIADDRLHAVLARMRARHAAWAAQV